MVVVNSPVEPRTEIQTAAHVVREIYLELLTEGFTEQQALVIVGQIILANKAS